MIWQQGLDELRSHISGLEAELEQLRAAAGGDAKYVDALEYALANIRDEQIPGDLEPAYYAGVALEQARRG